MSESNLLQSLAHAAARAPPASSGITLPPVVGRATPVLPRAKSVRVHAPRAQSLTRSLSVSRSNSNLRQPRRSPSLTRARTLSQAPLAPAAPLVPPQPRKIKASPRRKRLRSLKVKHTPAPAGHDDTGEVSAVSEGALLSRGAASSGRSLPRRATPPSRHSFKSTKPSTEIGEKTTVSPGKLGTGTSCGEANPRASKRKTSKRRSRSRRSQKFTTRHASARPRSRSMHAKRNPPAVASLKNVKTRGTLSTGAPSTSRATLPVKAMSKAFGRRTPPSRPLIASKKSPRTTAPTQPSEEMPKAQNASEADISTNNVMSRQFSNTSAKFSDSTGREEEAKGSTLATATAARVTPNKRASKRLPSLVASSTPRRRTEKRKPQLPNTTRAKRALSLSPCKSALTGNRKSPLGTAEASLLSTLPPVSNSSKIGGEPSPRKSFKKPKLSESLSVTERVQRIQKFIEEFQYNFDSRPMFISKNRPLSSLTECADKIIKNSSPIKCMEAVVLGIILTNGIDKLTRLCLRFKSTVEGRTYWHIVLCLRFRHKFGTLGLSRKSELAFKPIEFDSLYDLVREFRRCYVEECGHTVHRMTVGLPIGQSTFSRESVHWQYLQLPLDDEFTARDSDLLRSILDAYTRRSWDIKHALDHGAPIPVVHPDVDATREAMALRPKEIRELRRACQTMMCARADDRTRKKSQDLRKKLQQGKLPRNANTNSAQQANAPPNFMRSRSLSPAKSRTRSRVPKTGAHTACNTARRHTSHRLNWIPSKATTSSTSNDTNYKLRTHTQRVRVNPAATANENVHFSEQQASVPARVVPPPFPLVTAAAG